MNQRYLDYALYNIWANNRLIEDLRAQGDGIFTKELTSSFPDIRTTMLHIWYAETGWLSRLKGNGWEASKCVSFAGTNEELCAQWQRTSAEFKEFVSSCDLEKEVSFKSNDEHFSLPAREIVQTVFNHGSYHRGQLVTMMRQAGIKKITSTDYIEWVREKVRGNNN